MFARCRPSLRTGGTGVLKRILAAFCACALIVLFLPVMAALPTFRPGQESYAAASEGGLVRAAAETKLVAPDAAANNFFGLSVSVSGDTAVIGARESVYVFSRDVGGTWGRHVKLIPDGGHNNSGTVGGDAYLAAVSDFVAATERARSEENDFKAGR